MSRFGGDPIKQSNGLEYFEKYRKFFEAQLKIRSFYLVSLCYVIFLLYQNFILTIKSRVFIEYLDYD